jgi:four helix bundle protein
MSWALLVYRESSGFPKEELFGLTSRVRRAAVSIASDIFEGCGRSTDVDFLRFLDMANVSLRELQYKISLAQRLGYLPSQSVLSNEDSVLFETGRVLHGLIR